jgi:hypothetical protein
MVALRHFGGAALVVVVASVVVVPQVGAEAPELLAPPSGTTLFLGRTVPLTFTWRAGANVSQYRFQLSRESSFASPLVDRNVSSTSTVVRGLSAGRYYWRCSADGDTWSLSQMFTLRVGEQPPHQ